MNQQCFIILVINALAYAILFVVYQYKKRCFDIGSIILLAWVIGSSGSAYYYTFEVSYLSYDNITIPPLLFLFTANYLLFNPFLRTNYNKVKKIEVYNLRRVFTVISLFFSVIGILPLIDVILKLSSFSLVGAALADMYSADEDKTTLIFSPAIRPFFSIMRHFTVFIAFLFFYQLTLKKTNILTTVGLAGNLITFLLVSILSGSRGGIMSLLLICAFFLFFMKNIMKPQIVKVLLRMAAIICGIVAIGIISISISRLSDMSEKKGRELLMDQWISQYAGEGIVRYNHTIWHLDKHLGGSQNFPYPISFTDSSVKDLETFAGKAESVLHTPITVFYTYVGDLIIDFGIGGALILSIIIFYVIKYLIKIKKGSISFYHLIILSFLYEYLSIGFTANIFRTYYTQLQIVETLMLLCLIYVFQKLNEKRYALSCNSNSGI